MFRVVPEQSNQISRRLGWFILWQRNVPTSEDYSGYVNQIEWRKEMKENLLGHFYLFIIRLIDLTYKRLMQTSLLTPWHFLLVGGAAFARKKKRAGGINHTLSYRNYPFLAGYIRFVICRPNHMLVLLE